MNDHQWAHFWSKVTKGDGCWLWNGHVASDGYGRFNPWRPGVSQTPLLAHRLAYEDEIGPIPDGLQLDHLCRNRGCVNPAHLEPVTNQENTRRGKAVITHCPRGHEYNDENTYYYGPNRHRQCAVCKRELRQERSRRLGLIHNGAKTQRDGVSELATAEVPVAA